MRLTLGFDLRYGVRGGSTLLYLLRIHPDAQARLIGPELLRVHGVGATHDYTDRFGNRAGRAVALELTPEELAAAPDASDASRDGETWQPPERLVRFEGSALVEVPDEPDPIVRDAAEHDVSQLPDDVLDFLLPSRYCDVDSMLMDVAWAQFGSVRPGWERVQAVSDFVHDRLTFDYQRARATRTASEAYAEQVGVCRDFTHLFVTLCRCLNIPARYVAGYLGDIGVPADPAPMDFSAWAQVYLGGQWHTFDPRHNERRIGRVLMARGRDATDIAMVTGFGPQRLERFDVVTDPA